MNLRQLPALISLHADLVPPIPGFPGYARWIHGECDADSIETKLHELSQHTSSESSETLDFDNPSITEWSLDQHVLPVTSPPWFINDSKYLVDDHSKPAELLEYLTRTSKGGDGFQEVRFLHILRSMSCLTKCQRQQLASADPYIASSTTPMFLSRVCDPPHATSIEAVGTIISTMTSLLGRIDDYPELRNGWNTYRPWNDTMSWYWAHNDPRISMRETVR